MSCRVLVTSSGADVEGLDVPENSVVVKHVPHAEVLPFAAAVVSHGGHGTLAAALAHGVPAVCLPNPIIADQVPLSAQVQRLGADRALDGDMATPEEIAAAVEEVLTTPTYRGSAVRLSRAIAARPGAPGAAARLERLAEGTTQRTGLGRSGKSGELASGARGVA